MKENWGGVHPTAFVIFFYGLREVVWGVYQFVEQTLALRKILAQRTYKKSSLINFS
jgi:hypothetical protein